MKKTPKQTPQTLAYEELALALGRLCIADPAVYVAVQRGFTRGVMHEPDAGRLRDTPRRAREALSQVGHVFAARIADELAGVEPPKSSRRRRNRARAAA